MQNVLPTLELVGIIKPVFTEHRKNVVVNNGMQPLLGANISAAEIAVADAEALNSLRLMVPPLEEQNAFVNFVEQTDKSKVAVQKALDETQLLFDSLMQKYFR